MSLISRRAAVLGLGVGVGTSSLLLAGCDKIVQSPTVRRTIGLGEKATMTTQRLIADRNALAPEFAASERSPVFRTNGNVMPTSAEYQALMTGQFSDWKLKVDGMVANPMTLSLAQMRTAPQRRQTTRHDCVEGWSAIGEWTGVPLGLLLKTAQLSSNARYMVFHCADTTDGEAYYESIDLVDAFHPQTILAHTLNGEPLSVGHGAPLRLRVERQLGYKQAKYVMRVEAVASLDAIYGGKGGYWEDGAGYQWYAGI